MGDNKGRIIFLEHYLMDQSDESHPITTDELISILSEHGYSANRNTIHSDMTALQEAGIGVEAVRVANSIYSSKAFSVNTILGIG